MANSLISIGLTGINAAQAALTTTGHNISNVNTPSYSRQAVVQTSATAQNTGDGYFGAGVDIKTVTRIYNDFLTRQMLATQSAASAADSLTTQVQPLDSLLSSSASPFSQAVTAFFGSVNTLASTPSDTSARQNVLSAAQTLSDTLASMNNQMVQMRQDVNSQIGATVASINSYAQQIADLNRQISAQLASNPTQQPNDLLDQRDNLINQIGQIAGVTVSQQSDGSDNVYIGTGQALVAGAQIIPLSAQARPGYPDDLSVSYGQGGGFLDENSLTGGSLGGLLAFRRQALDPAQNTFGQIAVAVATAVNTIQAGGKDLNGNPGAPMFSYTAPTVASVNSSHNVSVAVSDGSALTNSDYSVTYDAANSDYVVTRLSDNQAQTLAAGTPLTWDGLTFTASGSGAAGDSYNVMPTRHAADNFSMTLSNGGQIAAAAPAVVTSGTANTGTATARATWDTGTPVSAGTLPATLTYTANGSGPGGTFAVNGGGSIAWTPGTPIAYAGISLSFTGTPATGDSFLLEPAGANDNTNALAMASVASGKVLDGGTKSINDVYAQLVAQIGTVSNAAQSASTTQGALASQAKTAQQSFSGVNLDEEAANLLQYQQAYQAASKVIQLANTLFQSVLQMAS